MTSEVKVKKNNYKLVVFIVISFILGVSVGVAGTNYTNFGNVLAVIDNEEAEAVSTPKDDLGPICMVVNKVNKISKDYIPDNLRYVNVPFTFSEKVDKRKMEDEAASALERMFSDAKDEGIILKGVSGYRSYETQEAIYDYSVRKNGKNHAEDYSAKEGESEHQTGLAMDLTADSNLDALTEAFANTKEGKWVRDNCYKYGFIIRYPKDKEDITGYAYEPWHVRYVGTKAAGEIYREGLTLEEYVSKNNG